MTTTTVNTIVSFSTPLKAGVDKVAKKMGTNRSHIINQALNNYLDLHKWQEAQIKLGLADAKVGRFYKGDWRNVFNELRDTVNS